MNAGIRYPEGRIVLPWEIRGRHVQKEGEGSREGGPTGHERDTVQRMIGRRAPCREHRRSLWIFSTIKTSFSRRELGREIFGNLCVHAVVTVGGRLRDLLREQGD